MVALVKLDGGKEKWSDRPSPVLDNCALLSAFLHARL